MTKTAGSRLGLVVFFGEDEHDRQAVRELFLGLRPDVHRGQTKPLRKPLTLVKNIEAARIRPRAAKVVATLRALRQTGPLHAAVFHEDADAVEPAHEDLARSITSAYRAAPCRVVAAVPAWEIEAWWLLFPTAVAAVSQQWRPPDQFAGKQVGLIPDAKERLKRSVRPPGSSWQQTREYKEEDSVVIAEKIVSMGLLRNPVAYSASWDSFVAQVTGV